MNLLRILCVLLTVALAIGCAPPDPSGLTGDALGQDTPPVG